MLLCMLEIVSTLLQDAVTGVQSLPSSAYICMIETLEKLMVLLSLVLNAYVCILFVKTWNFPQQEKKLDKEQISNIDNFLIRYSKTLESTDVEKDADDQTSWLVPKPGTKAAADDSSQETTTDDLRPVLDECAICMNQYTSGQRITWSSNPNCIHCFHTDCLRAWLLPSEPRNQLCPCCRQSYCLGKEAH